MCTLTYNVRRNEDIADVTDKNFRNWLLGKVKIHLVGIRENKTEVEFDLWGFRTRGDNTDHTRQCLFGENGNNGYFRNTASKNT